MTLIERALFRRILVFAETHAKSEERVKVVHLLWSNRDRLKHPTLEEAKTELKFAGLLFAEK